MLSIPHYIHGQFAPSGDASLPVVNPQTQGAYAHVARGSSQNVDEAVRAAQRAFPQWSSLSNSERAEWLDKLADGLQQRLEQFAQAESLNTGKPVALTRDIEIPRAVSNLRFFAAAATQFSSESHHGQAGLNYTLRTPLGVVGCISPWNLPLYLFTWKIAPALAAGNCVIAKPSEITPHTAHLFAELCMDIGLPAGVLNIVHGLGAEAGQAMVDHPDIKAISFTGSTKVGRAIAERCGQQLKKVSLELGGKNASLVFADAPREHLIPALLRSAFQNAGQICLCGSRLLIEQSVYTDIRNQLLNTIDELQIGPMISAAHHQKVLDALQIAEQEGGTILCGGFAASKKLGGWTIAPTLIEGLAMSSRTAQQEIFGPVLSLHAFNSEEEAVALANQSQYGLSASLWTQNLSRAHRVAAKLDAGIVWVNTWMQRDLRTPFGGMKDSGLGREGGIEAMRFFTEAKNICLNLTA
jgi:aminomuconate-semialdehyde/2-hydroxymuconate-6-semialdehyde dehydrogenase